MGKVNFDMDAYVNWIKQAENTLNSARGDLENKVYNWCCFKSQQAAEVLSKSDPQTT